jgi:hypothetical protein
MNGKAIVIAALLSLATTTQATLFSEYFTSSKGNHGMESKLMSAGLAVEQPEL